VPESKEVAKEAVIEEAVEVDFSKILQKEQNEICQHNLHNFDELLNQP